MATSTQVGQMPQRITRVRSTDHTWLGCLAMIPFDFTDFFASAGVGLEAVGLGRSKMSRAVVAETKTLGAPSCLYTTGGGGWQP